MSIMFLLYQDGELVGSSTSEDNIPKEFQAIPLTEALPTSETPTPVINGLLYYHAHATNNPD